MQADTWKQMSVRESALSTVAIGSRSAVDRVFTSVAANNNIKEAAALHIMLKTRAFFCRNWSSPSKHE